MTRVKRGWRAGMLVAGLAALLVAAGSSEAAIVTGNCDTGFSINAALATLDRVGPHTIEVTGTCREQVLIDQRDRVTIQGPVGGTATIVFPATGGAPVLGVVLIQRSRAILLRQLVIDGASRAQRGVLIAFGSEAQILGSRVENNTGAGVFVTLNSLAALGGNQATLGVALTNNRNQGAISTGGGAFLLIQGFTTIENNGRAV